MRNSIYVGKDLLVETGSHGRSQLLCVNVVKCVGVDKHDWLQVKELYNNTCTKVQEPKNFCSAYIMGSEEQLESICKANMERFHKNKKSPKNFAILSRNHSSEVYIAADLQRPGEEDHFFIDTQINKITLPIGREGVIDCGQDKLIHYSVVSTIKEVAEKIHEQYVSYMETAMDCKHILYPHIEESIQEVDPWEGVEPINLTHRLEELEKELSKHKL